MNTLILIVVIAGFAYLAFLLEKNNKLLSELIKSTTEKEDTMDELELLKVAKQIVILSGKASTAYLQRKLRIGYARAARIMDILEEEGIIGPSDGATPREIIIDKSDKANS